MEYIGTGWTHFNGTNAIIFRVTWYFQNFSPPLTYPRLFWNRVYQFEYIINSIRFSVFFSTIDNSPLTNYQVPLIRYLGNGWTDFNRTNVTTFGTLRIFPGFFSALGLNESMLYIQAFSTPEELSLDYLGNWWTNLHGRNAIIYIWGTMQSSKKPQKTTPCEISRERLDQIELKTPLHLGLCRLRVQ